MLLSNRHCILSVKIVLANRVNTKIVIEELDDTVDRHIIYFSKPVLILLTKTGVESSEKT